MLNFYFLSLREETNLFLKSKMNHKEQGKLLTHNKTPFWFMYYL